MIITLNSKRNRLKTAHEDRRPKSKRLIAAELQGLKISAREVLLGSQTIEIPEYTYPELGPGRCLTQGSLYNFVATIARRRWRIKTETKYTRENIPKEATVTFEETEEPDSPWQPYQPEIRNGSHVFGQPLFIQGPAFPHRNKVVASMLVSIDSRWGDAGNENIFVSLDENGLPDRLFYEASCC